MKDLIDLIPDYKKAKKIDGKILEYLKTDNIKRYVIGKNEESKELIKSYKIDGLIDDFEKIITSWCDIPIIRLSEVDKESIIINCSTSISPLSVQKKLISENFKNVISLNEIIKQGLVKLPFFSSEMRDELDANYLMWNSLYQQLEDDKSRNVLVDIVNYRLTADFNHMLKYTIRLEDQYFESFMNYNEEAFVDIGGFDGDSSYQFCKKYPEYKKIYFFEPSSRNMSAAKLRLKTYNNIEYLDFGLSDKDETLYFKNDNGSASAITSEGETQISVTTLDKIVTDKISFIKMDIEGWELKALKGAEEHIKSDKPKLAIAVYHNAKDFIEIPQYILSLNKEYKIFLRHYTEGWSETVMYFLPEDKI